MYEIKKNLYVEKHKYYNNIMPRSLPRVSNRSKIREYSRHYIIFIFFNLKFDFFILILLVD